MVKPIYEHFVYTTANLTSCKLLYAFVQTFNRVTMASEEPPLRSDILFFLSYDYLQTNF